MVLILAISVSGYVVEKRPKCVWFGCFGGSITNVEAKEITVTPDDISALVLNQIDKTEFRNIVTETVPSSHDLNDLYMVSDLGSKLSKFATSRRPRPRFLYIYMVIKYNYIQLKHDFQHLKLRGNSNPSYRKLYKRYCQALVLCLLRKL